MYTVVWERLEDQGNLLQCEGLELRTLVARIIKASKQNPVIIHSIKRENKK